MNMLGLILTLSFDLFFHGDGGEAVGSNGRRNLLQILLTYFHLRTLLELYRMLKELLFRSKRVMVPEAV